MLETSLFTSYFIFFTSIKFEVVFYDRGIANYNLQDKKSTLMFERPTEKFICTWDDTTLSPLSGEGENELNLDNFTKDPLFWSDWLVNNDDFFYGRHKKCDRYEQRESNGIKSVRETISTKDSGAKVNSLEAVVDFSHLVPAIFTLKIGNDMLKRTSFANTTTNFACTFEPEVEIDSLLVHYMKRRFESLYESRFFPIPGTCTFETPPVTELELLKKAELDYQKNQEEKRQEEIKREKERLERERERQQREQERKQRERERKERYERERQQREQERLEREQQRERELQEREKARQREQEEWEQQMMRTREKYGW